MTLECQRRGDAMRGQQRAHQRQIGAKRYTRRRLFVSPSLAPSLALAWSLDFFRWYAMRLEAQTIEAQQHYWRTLVTAVPTSDEVWTPLDANRGEEAPVGSARSSLLSLSSSSSPSAAAAAVAVVAVSPLRRRGALAVLALSSPSIAIRSSLSSLSSSSLSSLWSLSSSLSCDASSPVCDALSCELERVVCDAVRDEWR
jgi:hypothetical protein